MMAIVRGIALRIAHTVHLAMSAHSPVCNLSFSPEILFQCLTKLVTIQVRGGFAGMKGQKKHMDALERIARGLPADLVEASLICAVDEYPDLNVTDYLEQVQVMAEAFDIFVAGETQPVAVLHMLNEFFFSDLKFAGNNAEYYDPRNSYINEVIDRRTGIPITLSVLYRSIAASAGIQLEGVNLPGHFMLSHECGNNKRIYIDVFSGGDWLDWKACQARVQTTMNEGTPLVESDFEPMPAREILVRMLRNLKGIYSRVDLCRCLAVQKRLAQLLPNDPSESRDLGLLYYHNEKPAMAMNTLDSLLRQHPKLEDREFVRKYLHLATTEAICLN